jgi:copper homeostasis protein
MKRKLEIACFDLDSALIAARAGAHRIEFCASLPEGGTSPHLKTVKSLLKEVNIPVFVMVRPRGGDFVYTPGEFELMKLQVKEFREAGVQGLVFGCLTEQNEIDEERNGILLELAGTLPCTFHRAVDHTPDLFFAVEKLAEMGFKRVLTSGGKGNAMDHVDVLTELVNKFIGIGILPGGGVRSSNIEKLLTTGATEFHSSGITIDSNQQADPAEIRKLLHAIG